MALTVGPRVICDELGKALDNLTNSGEAYARPLEKRLGDAIDILASLQRAVRSTPFSSAADGRDQVLVELEKLAEGWIEEAWSVWTRDPGNPEGESQAQLKGFQANAVVMAVSQVRRAHA